MAISDSYATALEYRTGVNMSDPAKDVEILTDLEAISRYLDRRLGRFFNKDAADVTRLYLPLITSPRLYIDDLSAPPTSIKIDEDGDGLFTDETALAATDYQLYPLNAALEPEPWPYTSIVLTPWGTKGNFLKDIQVQVVGKFGWPTVPKAIKSATIQLTAILRLESARATTRISELDGTIGTSQEAQTIIKSLLDQYRVHYFV